MNWVAKDRVLVPVDFSEQSIRAVDTALEMVSEPSHVHLLHVLPFIPAVEGGMVWDTLDDNARRKYAEEDMRTLFADTKYQGLKRIVAFGDPGTKIAEYAENFGAGLIVLPSHGRTGLKRLLIGSVAERVCRLSRCPVLILRE